MSGSFSAKSIDTAAGMEMAPVPPLYQVLRDMHREMLVGGRRSRRRRCSPGTDAHEGTQSQHRGPRRLVGMSVLLSQEDQPGIALYGPLRDRADQNMKRPRPSGRGTGDGGTSESGDPRVSSYGLHRLPMEV